MYSTSAQNTRSLNDYLKWALLLSIIAHLGIAVVLTKRSPPAIPPPVLMVEFVPETRPAKTLNQPARQIVSNPDLEESKVPPIDTRLLAEKNFSTPEEKIHRGIDPLAGPLPGKRQQEQKASKNTAPQPKQQEAPKPKLKQLALDPDTLINDFSLSQSTQAAKPTEQQNTNIQNKSTYQAFTRPPGSGAAFVGMSGLPDYLPNLPDGDITLLNAKANLFAVFVRRVATQVFAQLRLNGWENLRAGDVNAISGFVIVRAVLSPEGKLLGTTIENSSGSSRFDDTVLKAAQIGAKDPNPPKAAVASDGNIHFIFQSKSWVKYGTAAHSGAPIERRWLLLGTGLE